MTVERLDRCAGWKKGEGEFWNSHRKSLPHSAPPGGDFHFLERRMEVSGNTVAHTNTSRENARLEKKAKEKWTFSDFFSNLLVNPLKETDFEKKIRRNAGVRFVRFALAVCRRWFCQLESPKGC